MVIKKLKDAISGIKKRAKKQYKAQQRQTLIDEMPISKEEFIDILVALSESDECYHDYRRVLQLLPAHSNKDAVLQWFQKNGGYCDCEVFLNVADAYSFLFDEKSGLKESNPQAYNILNEEEPPTPKESFKKISELNTAVGLKGKMNKPWQLFESVQNPNKYLFGFGKKGYNSELTATLYQYSLENSTDDKTFTDAWSQAYPNLSGGLNITQEMVELNGETFTFVIVSTENWTPCFIWIFNIKNMHWYLLARTQIDRLRGDIQELKNLLKNIIGS